MLNINLVCLFIFMKCGSAKNCKKTKFNRIMCYRGIKGFGYIYEKNF